MSCSDRPKVLPTAADDQRFDLAAGPLEQNNPVDAAHADDLERLRGRLQTSQDRLNDPMTTDE